MSSVVWVHTDRATFESWVRGWPALALPEQVRPREPDLREPDLREPDLREPDLPVTPVPPMVAASLALHGCAEVAVTLRLTLPEGDTFACFGMSGPLAAGLVRRGPEVAIGLLDVADLVEQVVGLVPERPPPPLAAATGCVRITVLGADAAVAGWQQILLAGESRWRRMNSGTDPGRLLPVSDVRRELAADLRFVLADGLAGSSSGD